MDISHTATAAAAAARKCQSRADTPEDSCTPSRESDNDGTLGLNAFQVNTQIKNLTQGSSDLVL